jgi:1-deoxy-D-xylulose-5-phosphate reductoisomerase
MSGKTKQITILGSTGSIGVSTLDVIARYPERFKIFALTANTNVERMAQQVRDFSPRYVVMSDAQAATKLRRVLSGTGCTTEVLSGKPALAEVCDDREVDFVMAAIVGAAGLLPTLAAVRAGKRVLLANKEALVMCGGLFMDAVQHSGAELLPIDSEHNAIFQCLPTQHRQGFDPIGVRRVVLTASGGPFRNTPLTEFDAITPQQACTHPNWSMGQKISVDSATMMNKGLELIEACWLFNTTYDKVDVLVHRQSVIHSMVEYLDGSVLAQMGNPDMRTPITYGLSWPQRLDSGVASLDLTQIAQLDFEPLDREKFPCVVLAEQAIAAGGTVPVALNAANEVAVAEFLAGRLTFAGIYRLVDAVLQRYQGQIASGVDLVLSEDARVRELADTLLKTPTFRVN